MEFFHEDGKQRRHGIGMKFSDYLNAAPTSKRANQTVNLKDEHKETILEQKN